MNQKWQLQDSMYKASKFPSLNCRKKKTQTCEVAQPNNHIGYWKTYWLEKSKILMQINHQDEQDRKRSTFDRRSSSCRLNCREETLDEALRAASETSKSKRALTEHEDLILRPSPPRKAPPRLVLDVRDLRARAERSPGRRETKAGLEGEERRRILEAGIGWGRAAIPWSQCERQG